MHHSRCCGSPHRYVKPRPVAPSCTLCFRPSQSASLHIAERSAPGQQSHPSSAAVVPICLAPCHPSSLLCQFVSHPVVFVLHGVLGHVNVCSPLSSLLIPHTRVPPFSTRVLERPLAATLPIRRPAFHTQVRYQSTVCPHPFRSSRERRLNQFPTAFFPEFASTSRSFRIRLIDAEEPNPIMEVMTSSLNGPCSGSRSSKFPSLISPSSFFFEAYHGCRFCDCLALSVCASTHQSRACHLPFVLRSFLSSQRTPRQPGSRRIVFPTLPDSPVASLPSMRLHPLIRLCVHSRASLTYLRE